MHYFIVSSITIHTSTTSWIYQPFKKSPRPLLDIELLFGYFSECVDLLNKKFLVFKFEERHVINIPSRTTLVIYQHKTHVIIMS